MECLARLPCRLLLSYKPGRDGCGRLLRGVFVFALRCAEWRRGGRCAASACYPAMTEGGSVKVERRVAEQAMRSLVS
jgi:hypothetical protein